MLYRFALHQGLPPGPAAAVAGARHLASLPRYVEDLRTYSRLPGAERLSILDSYPILTEGKPTTDVEQHYFHLGCWASRRVAESGTTHHVDIGSDHRMLGVL